MPYSVNTGYCFVIRSLASTFLVISTDYLSTSITYFSVSLTLNNRTIDWFLLYIFPTDISYASMKLLKTNNEDRISVAWLLMIPQTWNIGWLSFFKLYHLIYVLRKICVVDRLADGEYILHYSTNSTEMPTRHQSWRRCHSQSDGCHLCRIFDKGTCVAIQVWGNLEVMGVQCGVQDQVIQKSQQTLQI